MNRRLCPGLAVAVVLTLIAVCVPLSAADSAQATWDARPEVAGIIANVPPLKHPMPKGWQPTLFWWQAPLSFNDPAKLKEELESLAARGMLPCVDLSAEYKEPTGNVAASISQAKAIADAGFPVHLAMKAALDLYEMPDGKLVCHADSPDADKKAGFPCLLLQDGWKARAEQIRGIMKQLAAAKVPVAGAWYDYEGHPHPWNGIQGHMQTCPSCKKEFALVYKPPSEATNLPPLSDGFDVWVAWVSNFRPQALVTGLARPVLDVFPDAKIGFYGYAVSSPAHPAGGGETNPSEIAVAQPVCYASINTTGLSQSEVDQMCFLDLLLGALNGVVKNLRPDQIMMPYVSSRAVGDASDPLARRMSRAMYREFLRHAILRGARGFYCFNTAPPYTPMADYYAELADIAVICDELFAYPEFLEGGETLNQETLIALTSANAKEDWRQPGVPNEKTSSLGFVVNGIRRWVPTPKVKDATVWSGLRKGDKALIRAVTLGDTPQFMDVTPFPGVTVRLLASPAGTTCIVTRSGAIECVDTKDRFVPLKSRRSNWLFNRARPTRPRLRL